MYFANDFCQNFSIIKLQNEIAAQELLVRLERGDFEELKTKESSYHQLVKDNKKLHEKIKILEADR